MIIFDNHLHLRRSGRYLEAVQDFKKAGGTHFILCQYPMVDLVIKNRSYLEAYYVTLKMAEEIQSKISGVRVFITVGPYPVDYLKIKEKLGRDQSVNIMKKGIDQAASLCEKNPICVGIGEIGRPHFPVDEKTVADSNLILRYGMEKAKEVGVPVVLHTESTTPQLCKEVVELGKSVGLPPSKIVKHFSPPLVLDSENFGLVPSVLATKNNITEAISKGSRFMMETDYIDDLNRPGAVLGPKTVPRRTKNLIKKGVMSEENAMKIHKEIPEKTYNINLKG